jgi:LmbE family N-acetylglucosaminyl deacetylase
LTTSPLRLTSTDRVLAIAPHPDDESIGCGGLLLAARDAGAARRVVLRTDGDNNPWPQRWIEKRWRIDAAARARWGARRRTEAQQALDILGVAADQRVFSGFPDTALTSLLLHDADRLSVPLREQIAAFAPTHIAFPALTDRHPDHSAAHIATRLALLRLSSTPESLAYCVHGKGHFPIACLIELTAGQRETKYRAIASHRTQMALSGKRFLAYAAADESYGDAAMRTRDDHPLRAGMQADGTLTLKVSEKNLHGNRQVSILLADASGKTRAWQATLPRRERDCVIHDARSGAVAALVPWRNEDGVWTLRFALPSPSAALTGFVKLGKPRLSLMVLDRHGWQVMDPAGNF